MWEAVIICLSEDMASNHKWLYQVWQRSGRYVMYNNTLLAEDTSILRTTSITGNVPFRTALCISRGVSQWQVWLEWK